MAGRHAEHRAIDTEVSVIELIARLTHEGTHLRLANWPQRVVSSTAPPEDWPTGELPRLSRVDGLAVPGATAARDLNLALTYERSKNDDSADDAAEVLWGNRGPRPFQDLWPAANSSCCRLDPAEPVEITEEHRTVEYEGPTANDS